MLVLMLTLILTLPGSTTAQLSSENFQVDGFSVGSSQSLEGSSANFETTRETGGLFTQEAEQTTENDGGSLLNRAQSSNNTSADSGESNEPTVDDADSSAALPEDQARFEEEGIAGPGEAVENQNETDEAFIPGVGVDSMGTTDSTEESRTEKVTEKSVAEKGCADWLFCYFWYWWPPLLLLSLWYVYRTMRRR